MAMKYDGEYFDTDRVILACADQYTEEQIIEMEIQIFITIQYNITVLTPSEICYFLLKEFKTIVEKTGDNEYNENMFDWFCYKYIEVAFKEMNFCEFNYMTMAITAIICSFEHLNLKYKVPFVEWIAEIIPVNPVDLDNCRQQLHYLTFDMIEGEEQRYRIDKEMPITFESLISKLPKKSIYNGKLQVVTPRKTRLSTSADSPMYLNSQTFFSSPDKNMVLDKTFTTTASNKKNGGTDNFKFGFAVGEDEEKPKNSIIDEEFRQDGEEDLNINNSIENLSKQGDDKVGNIENLFVEEFSEKFKMDMDSQALPNNETNEMQLDEHITQMAVGEDGFLSFNGSPNLYEVQGGY